MKKIVSKMLSVITAVMIPCGILVLSANAEDLEDAKENESIPIPTVEIAYVEPGCYMMVASEPDKTVYHIGDKLDLTGLKLDVMFASGGEKPLSQVNMDWRKVIDAESPLENDNFSVDTSNFDSSKPGECYISISLTQDAQMKWWYSSPIEIPVIVLDEESVTKGDVNADGKFDIADVVILQKWLLGTTDAALPNWKAADFCEDEMLNAFDLCMMRRELLSAESQTNKVCVTNTEELKAALENAKAGDEIILAEGEYVYSGATPKGRMFTSAADGTEENPIVIRSENPEMPAIISGSSVSENYAFSIQGDWWEIKDLKITNAQKGIMLDHSNHTKIIGCEVYNIGSEGIHFRDNSSYCLAENCNVHDTGVVSPGSGEGIYVGSAKSTTDYGYECHYNTIRNCRLGPNVAAEHVDIKEYTIGTTVENCTFDGTGMSGENYSKSFVNVKGNDCVIRNNIGYRNGCAAIQRAFEQNNVVDGWGQNASVYGNKVYMDTATNAVGKKMYFLNAWDCSATVWDNFMAYDGELFSVDNEDDHWDYYNCNLLTYERK